MDHNNQEKLLKETQANFDLIAETGYSPELRRSFSVFSLLGVAFGLTNSWFGISGGLVAGISSGGPMCIIYGIIILTAFSTCIGITLSELASAYPNAAAQIYWAQNLHLQNIPESVLISLDFLRRLVVSSLQLVLIFPLVL